MKKIVLFLHILICCFLFNEVFAVENTVNKVDNEWLELDLPAAWQALELSEADINQGKILALINKSGDCTININLLPSHELAEQLIKQTTSALSAKGMIIGELKEKDGIYYCQIKKGKTQGSLYLGANGSEALMLTIFGNKRLQDEAKSLLSKMRIKSDPALFPKF